MEIIVAFIGIGGVFLGAILSELFRRVNRIESFNSQIFNMRIEIFMELYKLLDELSSLASEIERNIEDFEKGQLEETVSNMILTLAEFNDQNGLFLSDEIALHITSIFMGLEDATIDNIDEISNDINEKIKSAKVMIRNESGISHINKLMKKILKYEHKSPIIEYYHRLMKEQNQ